MLRVRYRGAEGVHWGELEGGRITRLTGMLGVAAGVDEMLSDVTLLPPCEPTVIVCVGLNYASHVREMAPIFGDEPVEPGLFFKAPNALTGPGDPIPYPAWTSELHYEGELAVVIGREMRYVSEEDVSEYILGFTCACDVTARDRQRQDLQWARAKSADGFCPVGPWVETDLDPAGLRVRTRVNGELRQDGDTADMLFSVPRILSYISGFMTLRPGDLVLTGTPSGVGELRVGDEVEVEVESIGSLVNIVEQR